MELRRQGIINSSPHLVSLSNSGILSFDTDMKSKVKECTVHFSPVQASGTPAPDNVLPISGWTGMAGYRVGVNLCPKFSSGSANGIAWIVGEDGVITFSGTASALTQFSANCHIPAGSLTFGCFNNLTNSDLKMFLITDRGNEQVNMTSVNATKTVTISAYISIVRIRIADGMNVDNLMLKPMICFGLALPEYVPYSGTTYSVTFPTVGKNLMSVNSFSLGGTNPRTIRVAIDTIPAGTYKISFTKSGTATGNYGFQFFDDYSLGNQVGFVNTSQQTLTLTGDVKSVYVYMNQTDYSNGLTVQLDNIQIESGSSATAYEPYTNTLGGGYVDLASGTLTATWVKKKISDFTWSYSAYNSANAFRTDDSLDLLGSSSEQGVMCSAFASEPMVVNYASSENKPNHTIYRLYTSVERRIFIKCTEYTSVSDFLATYGNEEIAYKLATPITYQLTPQQLSVLKGTNNVWSNANGIIDLSFWAHKEPNGGIAIRV